VALLWTAYLLVPASSWGLFRGVPVGVGGALVLFMVWWTWQYHHLRPGWRVLATLLLLKSIAAVAIPIDRGFEADYFANPQWIPPFERSSDFRTRSFTRIDPELHFGPSAPRVFPLYFVDARYRETQPFSVVWRGVVQARRAEDRRAFYLRGSGVEGELWVDGVQTVRLQAVDEEAVDRALWPAGTRRLTVRLRVPPGAERRFEAGFFDASGTKHALGQDDVTARAYPKWRLWVGTAVRYLATPIDAVLLVMLAVSFALGVRRQVAESNKVALVWLAIMAAGLLFTIPLVHRLAGLGERHYAEVDLRARNLILGGADGGDSPSAYALALSHLLLGEDLTGFYVLQCFVAGAVFVVLLPFARRLLKGIDLLVPPEPE
jgi:hypothetical protein